MKLLVTGARGQLGQTLLANAPPDVTLVGVDLPQLDITDKDQVRALVDQEGLAIGSGAGDSPSAGSGGRARLRQAVLDRGATGRV